MSILGVFMTAFIAMLAIWLRARGMWNPEQIKVADIKRVEKAFENAFSGKGWSPISNALRHKLPVRIGGLTDCFQIAEKETGTTLKLLKLLNRYDYPFMIVTKGEMVAEPEYLEEIAKGKSYVQVTIISTDDKTLNKIEPGAPPVDKRFEAIGKLSKAGVFVCGRLSPVIPVLSTKNIEEYAGRMVAVGAKHILAEFFRGTRKMIETIEQMAGISFMDVMVKQKVSFFVLISNTRTHFTKNLRDCVTTMALAFQSALMEIWSHRNSTALKTAVEQTQSPVFEHCSTCTANVLAREVRKKGATSLNDMKKRYWSPEFKHFEEMWESGRLAELVDGIKKENDKYVPKKSDK